jgi:hypothetical protein
MIKYGDLVEFDGIRGTIIGINRIPNYKSAGNFKNPVVSYLVSVPNRGNIIVRPSKVSKVVKGVF